MIPDEVVEQVRESADIVQIIGEYVNLKRPGTDFAVRARSIRARTATSPSRRRSTCTTASCATRAETSSTFCRSGSASTGPKRSRWSARSPASKCVKSKRREGPDPREPLWEVNATAAAYFQNMLWDDPLGEQAREYLTQRGYLARGRRSVRNRLRAARDRTAAQLHEHAWLRRRPSRFGGAARTGGGRKRAAPAVPRPAHVSRFSIRAAATLDSADA